MRRVRILADNSSMRSEQDNKLSHVNPPKNKALAVRSRLFIFSYRFSNQCLQTMDMETRKTLETRNTMETTDTIENMDIMEIMETTDTMDTMKSMENMDTMKTMKATDTMGTMKTLKTTDTMENMDTMETAETRETSCPTKPPLAACFQLVTTLGLDAAEEHKRD